MLAKHETAHLSVGPCVSATFHVHEVNTRKQVVEIVIAVSPLVHILNNPTLLRCA